MTGAETSHDNHAPVPGQASLQGLIATLDEGSRMDILERAFDFRGDVTLTLNDGRTVSGYLFDRRRGRGAADSVVRVLPAEGDAPLTVAYAEIARVEFGKDAAHGKTWENWVKRYVEKKTRGERASIEAEEA